MDNHNQNSGQPLRKQSPSISSLARRSSKRKRDDEYGDGAGSPVDLHQDLVCEISTQIEILDSSFSSSDKDRESAKKAINVLSELAKNGTENLMKNRNEKLFPPFSRLIC